MPLMEEIEALEKISYKEEIKQFKQDCFRTDRDLYDLILESLKMLWVKKYEKSEAYRIFEISKDFEKILFKDPRYRDHFIHQFQVFLSGLPVIDKQYDSIVDVYSKKFDDQSEVNIEFSWLLAASYHDNGYLVQKFDKWLDSFFTEFLDIKQLPVQIDLYHLLITRNFQEYIDKLTSLYSCLNNNSSKKWQYEGYHKINNHIRKLFTSKIINERNHGMISSLILLDRIEHSKISAMDPNYKKRLFSSVVLPAGLSICLHDKGIFTDPEIKPIEFKKDPISFLLIFCDTIQEWGRPIGPDGSDYELTNPQLSEYYITKDKVSATITYDKIITYNTNTGEKTNFDYKADEITSVLSKLKSSKPKFEITLQSLDKDNEISDFSRTCLR
ncbi:MAG: hypothetical protein A4E35_02404 [Methanoregula sp. PtaU1.Bin051]|nr:MAG: hypothetical protein A4E35_02404 [Methanoregula sp. PtaU1.Bin051]